MLISLRAKDPALGSCPGNWAPPELFVYLKGYHLCQYINMYQGKLALISSTVDCSHGCLYYIVLVEIDACHALISNFKVHGTFYADAWYAIYDVWLVRYPAMVYKTIDGFKRSYEWKRKCFENLWARHTQAVSGED
jgi:hypothetical protein